MRLKSGSQVHNVVRRSEKTFEVDGVAVDAAVSTISGPRFLGRSGTREIPVVVVRDGDHVFAQVGDRVYRLMVTSRTAAASSSTAEAEGGLEAPMPGRVTRVAVAVGDSVKRGQELIVVEAMKMENALVAPSDGMVKVLTVKVGDMVAPGPALIVIEAAS